MRKWKIEKEYLFALFIVVMGILYMSTSLLSETYPYAIPFVGRSGTFPIKSFKLGGNTISLYNLIILIDTLLMCLYCVKIRSRLDMSAFLSFSTGLFIFIFSFMGAKNLYILENLKKVREIGVGFGGVSFFGTVFLIPIVIPMIGVLLHKNPWDYLDFITPAGVFFLSFMRIGCFSAGCCAGHAIWTHGHSTVIPVQLFECALDFCMLAFLEREDIREKYRGGIYFLFMGIYGVIRFMLEFVRTNEKVVGGILSKSHFFAMISMAVCVVYLIIHHLKKMIT